LESADDKYVKQMEDSLRQYDPDKLKLFKELKALNKVYDYHNNLKNGLGTDSLQHQAGIKKNSLMKTLGKLTKGVEQLNIGNYLLSYSPLSMEYLPVNGFNIAYNLAPKVMAQFSLGNLT